jgi:hypothetical protein
MLCLPASLSHQVAKFAKIRQQKLFFARFAALCDTNHTISFEPINQDNQNPLDFLEASPYSG